MAREDGTIITCATRKPDLKVSELAEAVCLAGVRWMSHDAIAKRIWELIAQDELRWTVEQRVRAVEEAQDAR